MLDVIRAFAPNPSAVVAERDIAEVLPQAFESAVESGVIVPSDTWARHVIRDGRVLAVDTLPNGELEAFDEHDPDFDPVPLGTSDIAEWILDLPELGRQVATAEGLEPKPQQLGKRFVLAANVRRDLPLVVGLLSEGLSCPDQILAMRARLPHQIRGVILASTGYVPDATDQVTFERHSIAVAQLRDDLRIQPSSQACAMLLTATEPLGTLEPESGFLLAPDCRSATLRGRQFLFSSMQGAAVAVLIRAHMRGVAWLHQATILTEIESESSDLKSLFSRNPAFGTLLKGDSEGRFQLDLTLE